MSAWDAIRYGFSPIYWVTIGGLPVVFAERQTGLTLPSGYTVEDGSLVIDGSAEVGIEQVDREKGTAVSLSFGFKLLDTSTVRSWLRAPSKRMTLTADLMSFHTAATVDDTTGWSAGDAVYIGQERLTIGTVASATGITGLSRGTVGTLTYTHEVGTTAQLVTDRPRYWRGREVTLWASPTDPAGYVTGTNLSDDAVQVWRGRIDEGPNRETDGFGFQASSLDRILDRGLLGSVTGVVTDTSAKVAISSGYTITVNLRANKTGGFVWQYTFKIHPFSTDSDGDLLTTSEIRSRILTAWSTAVSDEGAGANVGSMAWGKAGKKYTARVTIPSNTTITGFEISTFLESTGIYGDTVLHPAGWSGGSIEIGWTFLGNPLNPLAQAWATDTLYLLTVRIDEGNAQDVPSTGRLRISTNSKPRIYKYANATTYGNHVYFTGVIPVDGQPAPPPEQATKANVEVLFTDSGSMPVMMLRALHTSGTGLRSGTYDTLKQGQGYGLDSSIVDAASFTSASAPVGTLQGEVSSAGASFGSLFGGSLGLFRKAVVSRPDDTGTLKLTMVNTAPYGADYSTTITDVDLLSDDGDPVVSVKKADSPNVIAIIRPFGSGDDGEDRYTFVDAPSVDANGRDEVEYLIPATDRVALYSAAGPAVASHLAADQTTQAIRLRVPPWTDVQVGDVVQLAITHPAIWTWSTSPGQPGYSGAARVVGRTIELSTTAVTLTLLIDSSVSTTSLSPAALVSNFDSATAPTWIDLDLAYLQHMQTALAEAGANIWVSHYQPGQIEAATQLHEVSAATETGGKCRLTIASTSGGHSLSTTLESTLTLPTTNGGKISDWQGNFAHVSDGTTWG